MHKSFVSWKLEVLGIMVLWDSDIFQKKIRNIEMMIIFIVCLIFKVDFCFRFASQKMVWNSRSHPDIEIPSFSMYFHPWGILKYLCLKIYFWQKVFFLMAWDSYLPPFCSCVLEILCSSTYRKFWAWFFPQKVCT